MKTFSQLKKNRKNDFSNLKPVKVALLGDTATQFLGTALRGAGYKMGFDRQIQEANPGGKATFFQTSMYMNMEIGLSMTGDSSKTLVFWLLTIDNYQPKKAL